jgi:dethiobiotin synthetase
VRACGCEDERELICPYMLREPLAPEVAAELEGVRIDVRRILRAFRKLRRTHEVLVVEGAGGMFVPIKKRYFMIDLMAALSCPVVVVARPALGTINHTLLTCEVARAREIELAGIILNGYGKVPSLAERTNPGVIRRYAGTRLLGMMPHLPGVSVSKRKYEGLLDATEGSIDIPRVLDYLRRASP